MVDPRYITITVRYDREPKYGRSLEWIAPELKDSALAMTEDHLDDPTPSRTWAGLVDGPMYEQFAKAWHLPIDAHQTEARTSYDDRHIAEHIYTLDGMNWESGTESPIICVSLRVLEEAPCRDAEHHRLKASEHPRARQAAGPPRIARG